MTKFDLKKIIAENKATFFSSINEGYDAGVKKGEEIEKKKLSEGSASSFEEWLEGIQIAYPKIADEFKKYGLDKAKSKEEFINIVKSEGTLYNPDLNFYKLGDKVGTSDKRIELSQDNTTFGDYANENDNRIVPSNTDWKSIVKPSRNIMTKEELKRKIKEMIVAEINVDVTNLNYDPVAETIQSTNFIVRQIEDKMDKDPKFKEKIATIMANAEKGNNEKGNNTDLNTDLALLMADITKMHEAKKEDEATDAPEATDVEVSAEETPTSDSFEVSTSEVDPTIKAIQDALTQAQAAAQKLGDEKLTDQIGNTITFFTRTHIANKDVAPVAEELNEVFINKMKFRAGIIK